MNTINTKEALTGRSEKVTMPTSETPKPAERALTYSCSDAVSRTKTSNFKSAPIL